MKTSKWAKFNKRSLSERLFAPSSLQGARSCGRYMHMKKILFFMFCLITGPSFADYCERVITPENGKLTITRDSDPQTPMYHVRLPAVAQGLPLRHLSLSAWQEENSLKNELVLPLQIKQKGEITGSYFYLSSHWVKVKVTGSYGEDMCVELSSELGM